MTKRELEIENYHLKLEIKRLLERIVNLERQLGLDSNNSNKPPSSDGLAKKPRNSSLRVATGKTSGGQKGHQGHTLKQTETPNTVIACTIDICPKCQASLINQPTKKLIKRQVVDIPEPKSIVTEYQSIAKTCPNCHEVATGIFPEGVNAPVQYGPRVESFVTYLQTQHLIPEERTQEIMQDCFGLSISTATITNASAILNAQLDPFEKELIEYTKIAPVKNADETGLRIGGKTNWFHTLSTPFTTWYRVSNKRKCLIEGLSGTIVHDHWKAYYQLTDMLHGLCNAHHLRELKALIEIEKEEWAQSMYDLLKFANETKYKYEGSPPVEIISEIRDKYNAIIKIGLEFHEAQPSLTKKSRGKQPHRIGHNLLLRLQNYADDVLRFLTDPVVPFTNNLAEQDLRMVKVKQKISGGFRTFEGAARFARIRSLISTARKLGLNILNVLMNAFKGKTPQLPVTSF